MAYSGQGSGTEQDPYLITTLNQMIECFNVYSNTIKPSSDQPVHVYCKLMNDIDFNNYPDYWQCVENMFYANNREPLAYSDRHHFIQIDGNGHGLYNMYCYDVKDVFHTYSDSSSHQNRILLKNMTLEVLNIVDVSEKLGTIFNGAPSDSVTANYNSGIFFTNCDLRIKYYPYKTGNPFITWGAGKWSENMEEISIPKSVLWITDYAFWGTKLKRVRMNRHCIYFEHSFPPGCVLIPYKEDE